MAAPMPTPAKPPSAIGRVDAPDFSPNFLSIPFDTL